MKNNYSIEEILGAMDELYKKKREKNNPLNKKTPKKINNSNIPLNTLKLIEEAEKSNN